ncbi:hypothetical protein [Kordiimonas marina]|uniref:hypothetical protein n=1 Tax=Kordiimonas marina TaxID=2872312 RepID=UPI001FF39426|nr:hypothetical protein [Kordiimonas marina]MCJ9430130.1 hypothetical protein [Kordiimonas marina]
MTKLLEKIAIRLFPRKSQRQLDVWQRVRTQGPLFYIFKRGILRFGLPVYLLVNLFDLLSQQALLIHRTTALGLTLWTLVSLAFGAYIWVSHELAYRRQHMGPVA